MSVGHWKSSITDATSTQPTAFRLRQAHTIRIIFATIQSSAIIIGVISLGLLTIADINTPFAIRCRDTFRQTKRDTRMRRQAQKERFSLRVDEGIEKQTVERLPVGHFPTQKFLKIVPSTSSVVTSPPVISARWWRHSRKSCATKSPESPDCNPCRTRRTSSSAAESAA